jgi:hypothetical protein
MTSIAGYGCVMTGLLPGAIKVAQCTDAILRRKLKKITIYK